ncbi:hypothetical protein FQN49_005065 [Arthroderma sp. PD_2]|nr:hypothetical protein FQN49_005065 [Arthroderma sp. PD_2]
MLPLTYAGSLNDVSFPGAGLHGSMHPKARFQSRFYKCDPYRRLISDALADLPALLSASHNRLSRLKTILDSNPTRDTILEGSDRSTLYTFETMFGDLGFGGPGYRNRGKRYLDHIITMTNTMLGSLPTHRLEIWCGDDYISKTPAPGIAPRPDKPNDWWDVRPAEVGGQQWTEIEPHLLCINPENMATQSSYTKSVYGDYDLVVLCPHFLDTFIHSDDELTSPYRALRDVEFDQGAVSLDEIAYYNLAFVMLHELSHSKILLGDIRTDDVKGLADGYGFAEVAYHGESNSDKAVENAAMGLYNHDWSTGSNHDMYEDGPAGDQPDDESDYYPMSIDEGSSDDNTSDSEESSDGDMSIDSVP